MEHSSALRSFSRKPIAMAPLFAVLMKGVCADVGSVETVTRKGGSQITRPEKEALPPSLKSQCIAPSVEFRCKDCCVTFIHGGRIGCCCHYLVETIPFEP
jgi:hypothetical protein